MPSKEKIATLLYGVVMKKKLSFHSALKIYKRLDTHFSRALSSSARNTRKNLIAHMIEAAAPDAKMCWTSIAFPVEILYPFDIYPMTLEVMAGLFATMGLSSTFLDMADAGDIPNTMCSFHRTLLGVSETHFLGRPKFVGSASILCDGNLKSFAEAAKNQDVPFVFIDVPFEPNEDGIQYVKEQLKGAINLIEEIAGKRADDAKLRQTAKNVNDAFEFARSFYKSMIENRKNLFMGHEIANFAFPMHFMLGSRRVVDLLRDRCEAVQNGMDYNRFYDVREFSETAKRIMWLHIVPQYDNDLWSVIDDGQCAKIVCDEYSSPYYEDYDINDPLGSIAKRLINHPSNGPIERRIEHILKIARDYKVDGIIHYSSWGCHQAAGNVQMLGKAILDAGYKFLNLSSDPIDTRNTSPEQHRTRLEAFLES